jgi:hypothetical protein
MYIDSISVLTKAVVVMTKFNYDYNGTARCASSFTLGFTALHLCYS